MARLVVTASLAVLLFSLLAVANCRVREADPAELGTANPVVSREADAAEVVIPATVAAGEGFLRLPSHQRHRRPCLHGHGLFHRHHGLSHRHGDARADNDDLTVVLPMEVAHEEERRGLEQEETEVQAVAEPDPDSRPDTDGEHETEEATVMPFHGEEQENDGEMMKAWKVEMLRRFRHGLRFHHHRHHHDDEEDQEDGHEHDKEDAGATKRLFHFHHHHDGEEEMTSKRFQFHQRDSVKSEGEEETAGHWRKAMMRGRFHHGRRHHHHRHHADEEAEKEGGVMKWFMDLVNRF